MGIYEYASHSDDIDELGARAPGGAPGRSTATSRIPPSARAIARAILEPRDEVGGAPLLSMPPSEERGTDPFGIHLLEPATDTGSLVMRAHIPADAFEPRADAFDDAISGGATSLPHQSQLEQAFGTDLGSVAAHVGTPQAQHGLHGLGARAAAHGNTVAFAESDPSLHQVAHEVAHVLQQRGGGGGRARGVSDPGDAAEVSAHRAADAVVRGERVRTAGTADASRVHRDPIPIESSPRGEDWTADVDDQGNATIHRERGGQALPDIRLSRADDSGAALVRAGVNAQVAARVAAEIRRRGRPESRPLRVSFAGRDASQTEESRRAFLINRVRDQDNAMAAVENPLDANRRRTLVMGNRVMAGGDALTGSALIFRALPDQPYNAIPARNENIRGDTVTRPTEYDHRDARGHRRTARIEALGAVEVDDQGVVVEIICYSRHLEGGLAAFIALMNQSGWRVELRSPPRHEPVEVTPVGYRERPAQAPAQPQQPAAQPATQPGARGAQADFGPDAPAFLQWNSAAPAPAAAAPAPAAAPAAPVAAPDAWNRGIAIAQIVDDELPHHLAALMPEHHIMAPPYRLVPHVHDDDPQQRIVYYMAMNESMRSPDRDMRAEFVVGPGDVATFTSNVTLYRMLGANFYGFTFRRPAYVVESGRVGYLFSQGRFRDGLRALGRSWLEAFRDPEWYMQAIPATVGALGAGGAAAAGEAGAAGEANALPGRTGVRVNVSETPPPAAEVEAPLPPSSTPRRRGR